jgi:polar amino acid transport system permease protein
MGYQLNFAPVWRDFDLLLSGLALGLVMAIFAVLVVGNLIGLAAAFAMTSRSTALRRIASAYVTVIRNLPIFFLMLVTFFVLPQQFGIRIDKVHAFVGTLSVYAGAYLTEVYRGALLALPKGLREAGLAIGLTEGQTRLWVILPVMLRNALPALSNNFISLFKDTSVAAAIAVPELTFYARQINNNTFRVIEVWSVCSLMYVAVCYLIAAGLRVVERRLAIPH